MSADILIIIGSISNAAEALFRLKATFYCYQLHKHTLNRVFHRSDAVNSGRSRNSARGGGASKREDSTIVSAESIRKWVRSLLLLVV